MDEESSSGSVVSVGDYPADHTRARSRADQVLRSILVTSGLLEDVETTAARVETGEVTTLRGLRAAGALGQMRENVQTALLGSILYAYDDGVVPTRASEARHAAIGRTPPRTTDARSPSPIQSDPSFVRLRQGVERLLQDSILGSIGDSQELSGPLTAGWRSPATSAVEARLAAETTAAAVPAASPASAAASTDQPELAGLTEDEQEFFRMIHQGNGISSSIGDSDEPEDPAGGRSMPSTPGRTHNLGGRSVQSTPSSAHVPFAQRQLSEESGDSELLVGLTGTAGSSSVVGDNADESVTGFLRRLASEDESLVRGWLASDDDGLIQSSRRVLQMGAVLAGARLSEEEIRDLPKVRFEQAEEQQCSICLEAFRTSEFITELPCSHFFHVSCVATWFRTSAQCPLCRSNCLDNSL